jgi:hypothetical protein
LKEKFKPKSVIAYENAKNLREKTQQVDCWKKTRNTATCNNSLFGRFFFFICVLFLLYYIVYVAMLVPFIQRWFTNRTLGAIESEFSNQSNQRQLNVIRNIANGLNFFLKNQ